MERNPVPSFVKDFLSYCHSSTFRAWLQPSMDPLSESVQMLANSQVRWYSGILVLFVPVTRDQITCFTCVSSVISQLSTGYYHYIRGKKVKILRPVHSHRMAHWEGSRPGLHQGCLSLLVFSTVWLHLGVMTWRRKWQPTPVLLPREFRGQKSLVGCRLWDCTESDMTEAT